MTCPLCEAKKITKRYYEDNKIWIANCSTHPSKKLVVLKRHVPLPTTDEAEHIQQMADKLFLGKAWRYPESIKEHFHLHEV